MLIEFRRTESELFFYRSNPGARKRILGTNMKQERVMRVLFFTTWYCMTAGAVKAAVPWPIICRAQSSDVSVACDSLRQRHSASGRHVSALERPERCDVVGHSRLSAYVQNFPQD